MKPAIFQEISLVLWVFNSAKLPYDSSSTACCQRLFTHTQRLHLQGQSSTFLIKQAVMIRRGGEGDLVGFNLRLAVGFRFTKFPMIRDDMLLGC